MKITAKQGKSDKIHISIDGEYLTTVDSAYWYGCGYVSGDEINEQELAAFKSAAGSRRAFNAGADLIARREHSEKELRSKLMKRFSPEESEEAVERLIELGLVDDGRFARMYAKEMYERKGMGRRRIEYELAIRGIGGETARAVTDELFEDDDNNIQRIVDIIEKKYYNINSDEKVRRRAWAALQRLGYSYDEIRQAVRAFCDNDYDEEGWE